MRVLHYSHDHYGMDNLQRTLAGTKQVALGFQQAVQLVVTGSPQPRNVGLPENADYIKLPSTNESYKDEFHAPFPSLPFDDMKIFPDTLLFSVIQHFKPDVVVVEADRDVQENFLDVINHLKQEPNEINIVLGSGKQDNVSVHVEEAFFGKVPNQSLSLFAVDHDSEDEQLVEV